MGILQRFTLIAGLCAREWMTSLLHSVWWWWWWCCLLCCVWCSSRRNSLYKLIFMLRRLSVSDTGGHHLSYC